MRSLALVFIAFAIVAAGLQFILLAGCAAPARVPAAARLPAAAGSSHGASSYSVPDELRARHRPAAMATVMAPTPTPTTTPLPVPREPFDWRPEAMITAIAMPTATDAPPTSTPRDPTPTPTPVTPSPTPSMTPTPTATPTMSFVEVVEATWTADAATPVTPTAPPLARPRTALGTSNAGDVFSTIALPDTLAGVHFAGPEITSAKLFDRPPGFKAWAVEVAYASDENWEASTAERILTLYDRGFRVMVRIDYARKQQIPPLDDPQALDDYAEAFVRLHKRTGRWTKFFIVGNEGNVDESGDSSERRTECLAGRESCIPAAHATAYRAVRKALVGQTDAYVLLGAASPGTVDHPARWMDGSEYLKAVLQYLHPSEVDGIALHAYAPEAPGDPQYALAAFASELSRQIEAAEEAGYVSTPLFVTEMNQQGIPDPDFISAAYSWIDAHNSHSRQDIVAACWFVYHDETGAWGHMALENSPAAIEALSRVTYPPGR